MKINSENREKYLQALATLGGVAFSVSPLLIKTPIISGVFISISIVLLFWAVFIYRVVVGIKMSLFYALFLALYWSGAIYLICYPLGLMLSDYNVPKSAYAASIFIGLVLAGFAYLFARKYKSLNKLLLPTANAAAE